MPKATLLIILMLILVTARLQASPQLYMAKEFNVVAVNGEKYDSGLTSGAAELALLPGLNRIAIQFEQVYDDENGDGFDLVKSNLFLLNVYLEADARYRQKILRPADARAARRYCLNPVFDLLREDQTAVSSPRFTLEALPNNDSDFAVNATRLKANPTLLLTSPGLGEKSVDNIDGKGESMASKMLRYWWQQATPEEQQAFLKSIRSNR